MGDLSRQHDLSQQRDLGQDSERAETYLRLLVEAALRATPRAGTSLEHAAQVHRVADILFDAGVLDYARADEILLTFAVALSVRGQQGFLLSLGRRRVRWVGAITAPGSKARQPGKAAQPGTGGQPGTGRQSSAPAPGDDAWRVIQAPSGQVPGSKLMALIVTGDRMIAPATLRFPPSAGLAELEAPSFADLTASDDIGSSYQVSFTDGGWTGSTWTGTMLLRPPPPPGARLLTITSPNGPVLRAQLNPDPAARQPVATIVPLADSPGERLLIRRAEALLALASPDSPAWHVGPAALAKPRVAVARAVPPVGLSFAGTAPPNPVTPAVGPSPIAVVSGGGTPDREPDLAEVIAILEGARILSPLSPIPAKVAALAQVLGGTGTASGTDTPGTAYQGGLGASSSVTLPARWHAVLAY